MLKIDTQAILAYLWWFRCNLLLRCVSIRYCGTFTKTSYFGV